MAEKIMGTIIDGLVIFLLVAALVGFALVPGDPREDELFVEHDKAGYCQKFPCFTEPYRWEWVSLKYMTRGR